MDRKDPKKLPVGYQERRRLQALEQQKAARKIATSKARKLAQAVAESEGSSEKGEQEDADIQDVATSGGGGSSSTSAEQQAGGVASTSGRGRESGTPSPGRALKQQYAEQLMQPEWLIEVPEELGGDWYVMPRPEGRRCLVIAAKGRTAARLRNGALFETFSSLLPAGGAGTPAGADAFSILDCIYHEPDQTYYVMDLLCWRGYALHDCSSEFRLFWVGSKLAEDAPGVGEMAGAPGHTRRFAPVPIYRCTPEGLAAAHSSATPFTKDGLYLLHREAHYSAGPTPLAMLWKDAGCSSYVIDTDAEGVPLPQQLAVLEYRMDGTVATNDDPPAVLGRMPPAFVQQMGAKLRPGRLLRFCIGPGGVYFADGQPAGADLHFEGPANQRRGRADSLSKIVFQHQARTAPITLQQLLAAAAAGRGPSGDADVLLHMTSTASMSLVASEARGEAEGSMLTDGGGSVGLEVEMG